MRTLSLPPSLLLLVAIVICGCDNPLTKKAKPVVQAEKIATPEPIQRIQGSRLKVEEAMRFDDLSFLIRSGTPEEEVLNAIKKRGLLDTITPIQVKALEEAGASPKIVTAIQDPRHVLTYGEKADYYRREQERNLATRAPAYVDEQRRAVEFAERQRQIEAQQKTLAAVEQKQWEAKQREKAKRDYETKRAYLDSEKQRIQAQMNDLRRAGSSEQSIGALAQRLKEVEEQRSNLKVP